MKILCTLLTALLTSVLLASAYFSLTAAIGLIRAAHALGQQVATLSELLYGVTAVLALVLLARRHPWSLRVLAVWAGAVTLTTALAPVVWGQAAWAVGAASAAAVAFGLGVFLGTWQFVRVRAARLGTSMRPD